MDDYLRLKSEGDDALQQGDFDSAVVKFSAALPSVSDAIKRSELLYNRSSTYMKLGRYGDAIIDAKECVKLRPDWSEAYLQWGKALEASGDVSEACNVYVNAIKRGEGHEKLLLQPLTDTNVAFSKEFMDVLRNWNDKYCEVCHEMKNDLSRCSRCCVVYYCCKNHQKQDWPKHKTQCKLLAEAFQYLSREKELEIQSDLPWMMLVKQFHSLEQVVLWSDVWDHLQCIASTSDVFRLRMSESLSWCLTLIRSICKFDLANKERLVVHILGADDNYSKEGYFKYFSGFFPFPDMDIVLIGPDLIHSTSPLNFRNSCGSLISISYFNDVWHKYILQPSYCSPDLIIAYHPGIHEEVYNWKPTISVIISESIPTVLTAWHKEDFLEMHRVISSNTYSAKIVFSGKAPFPSFVKRYARKRWNEYGIQTMNSYWVGFKGKFSTGQL